MYISKLTENNDYYKASITLKEMEQEIENKLRKEGWISIELVEKDYQRNICILKEKSDGVYKANILDLLITTTTFNTKFDDLPNPQDYLSWIRIHEIYRFSRKLFLLDNYKAHFEIDLVIWKEIRFENLKIFMNKELALTIKDTILSKKDLQIWWTTHQNNIHLENDEEFFNKFILSKNDKNQIIITALDEFGSYKKSNCIVVSEWDQLWQLKNCLFLQKQDGKCYLLYEKSLLLEVPWEFLNIQNVELSYNLLSIITKQKKINFRISWDVVENFEVFLKPEEECLNLIVNSAENLVNNYILFKYDLNNYGYSLMDSYSKDLEKLNPTLKLLKSEEQLFVFLSKLNKFSLSFWDIKNGFLIAKRLNKWEMIDGIFTPLAKTDWTQWGIQITANQEWLFKGFLISISSNWELKQEKELFKAHSIRGIPEYCVLKTKKWILLQYITGTNQINWKNLYIQNHFIHTIAAPKTTYVCFQLHGRYYLLWRTNNCLKIYRFNQKTISWEICTNQKKWEFKDLLAYSNFLNLTMNRQLLFQKWEKWEVIVSRGEKAIISFRGSWAKLMFKQPIITYRDSVFTYGMTIPQCIFVYCEDYSEHNAFIVLKEQKQTILNARWKKIIRLQNFVVRNTR